MDEVSVIETKSAFSKTTSDINVSVVPQYLDHQSSPEVGEFAFSYTITIENLGSKAVQLIERHWYIVSADAQVGEIIGPGVVGLTPTLAPGETFTYTSGAMIKDPVGAMEGVYTFKVKEDGEKFFHVAIPRFALIATERVN